MTSASSFECTNEEFCPYKTSQAHVSVAISRSCTVKGILGGKPCPHVKVRMVLMTLYIPPVYQEKLDSLIRHGNHPNRAEAIRVAMRDMFIEEGVW